MAWSFLPTAQDADGDKLTFSVMNKPAWLSFDETTGRLWGKPTTEHVGNHLQIRISVSDGKESASLPPSTSWWRRRAAPPRSAGPPRPSARTARHSAA